MSDTNPGPGWWQASDGQWYPPGQEAEAPPPKKLNSTLVTVLAVASVLMLLGVGGCVATVVAARDSVEEEVAEVDAAVDDFDQNRAAVVGSDELGNTGTAEGPLPQGTEVDLANGWRVTVNSADTDAGAAVAAADRYNAAAREDMRFVVVNLTAAYEGNADGTAEFPAVVTSVFGSDGVERSTSDTLATPPEPRFDSAGELLPGTETTGNLLFEVPENETDLVIRFQPVFSLDSSEAWFSLQE